MSDESHSHTNYVKIWGILVALLVVSVLGPMLEIQAITLITAFGIAVVKAYIVVTRFMHLNVEKKYVHYFLGGTLAMMAIFFTFVAPDVMSHKGQNWENRAAEAEVKRVLELQKNEALRPHASKPAPSAGAKH